MKLIHQITIMFVCIFISTNVIAKTAETVGIVAALDEEIRDIRAMIEGGQELKVNNQVLYQGAISGHPVILVKSGVGKVNVSATTQLLISKYDVRRLVFTGVAGGIKTKHHIGDVVVAQKLAEHDYGIISPKGFQNWKPGTLFGSTNVNTMWYVMDKSLLFKALKKSLHAAKLQPVPKELSKGASHLPKIVIGNVVTGDQFIASEEKRKWLETTFNADAVEMEGAAFAQVCANNQVNCVVIRTISDLANESSHVDFPKFAAFAAGNSAQIVKSFLKHY